MKKTLKTLIILVSLIQLLSAQQTSLNCKYTNIGPVGTVLANTGEGSYHIVAGKCEGGHFNEYPVGAGILYGVWGLWVGAKRDGKRLVSTSLGGNPNINNEFFPTTEPWDTVYTVENDEVLDLPYWPNYQRISNLDMITRYNDFTILRGSREEPNIEPHTQLGIEVIEVVYVFTGFPVVVRQYWIVARESDLSDVYVGWAGNSGINDITEFGNDEWGSYDAENRLGFQEDLPERNDLSSPGGTVAFRFFADPEVPEDSLVWSWDDGIETQPQFPDGDQFKYELMKGGIQHDAFQTTKYGHFIYAFGPFQLSKGDTLHFTAVQIHGVDKEDVYDNYLDLLEIKENGYSVPSPPPRPPLRAEVGNHQVTLNWFPLPGDTDPETYSDDARLDGEMSPFEGYRVYKSVESINGPWILLAEFDREGDEWGNNNGLQRTYTDIGLLNNFTYYYSVTAFSKPDIVLDIPALESSVSGNSKSVIPGTAAPETVGQVIVVPNPYRGDSKYYELKPAWERGGSQLGVWTEEDRRIQFVNLPNHSKISIYTVSGKYITSFDHDIPNIEGELEKGVEDWNMTAFNGQAIASGVYLFTVEDLDNGKIQSGKFVVIK